MIRNPIHVIFPKRGRFFRAGILPATGVPHSNKIRCVLQQFLTPVL